ncbi:MAG: N-formylglutamate amidohydrolase [Polyangiaceae bacterium]
MDIRLEDAAEIIAGPTPARVVLTCEHASERLPEPWEWPEADRWLVGTHWAYDIGASDLTREVAVALGAPAVLARFSRLLVDPNRPRDSDTLFRAQAEGRSVALNAHLSTGEQQTRLRRLYDAFHARVHEVMVSARAEIVLAMHTFTPEYEGIVRQLEVGVLFDRDEALALRVRDELASTGLAVGLNEPYSGRQGMMYSADLHASRHGCLAVELEVRQDLAVEAVVRRRIVEALHRALAPVAK